MSFAKPIRPRTKPTPLRPALCDRVHVALVKAGRPVTCSELRYLFLVGGSTTRTADVQTALDALVVEGLAARGEERGRLAWQHHVVWRAVGGDRR